RPDSPQLQSHPVLPTSCPVPSPQGTITDLGLRPGRRSRAAASRFSPSSPPERTIAGWYNLINTYFGGQHPTTGRSYVCYVWAEGGLGGTLSRTGRRRCGASATRV